MKKYKKIAYIFLILIIVALSFTVYATVSKDTGKIEKEKRISEFEYLESELVDIFNELNNIQMSNYNVSVNNITSQTKKKMKVKVIVIVRKINKVGNNLVQVAQIHKMKISQAILQVILKQNNKKNIN